VLDMVSARTLTWFHGSNWRQRRDPSAADDNGLRAHRQGFLRRNSYLPNGAFTFASSQAYRLAYTSQREQPHDRARRALKLRGNLGAVRYRGPRSKPKLVRWQTYDRKLEEVFAAEAIVDAYLGAALDKLSAA
jgi:hypothetical protein